MKIKAIAIDDEPLALNVLKMHCRNANDVELVECFTDPNVALNFLHVNDVDVIFLDIRLQEHSGIKIAYDLRNRFPIIFTTAYPEYAVAGFDLNAVDYLLKPITFERFEQAIQKLTGRTASVSPNDIFIKDGNETHRISINDIICVETAGNYIKLHCIEKTILTRNTLKDFLQKEPCESFIQSHKSFAFNKRHLLEVNGINIKLKNLTIPLSQSYKQEVYQKLGIKKAS